MLDELSNHMLATTQHMGSFISLYLLKHRSFKARSFYAEAFSLAFLEKTKQLSPTLRKILKKNFQTLDKRDKQFHWEFNRYALQFYQKASQDTSFLHFVEQGKFCSTPLTNWILLKSTILLGNRRGHRTAVTEAKKVIAQRQDQNGLIKDDQHVCSFQYHCFSLAMLIELWELSQDPFFESAFFKGIQFIRTFILSTGDTLYIGRGQQQLFGYVSLLYSLAKAFALSGEKNTLKDLRKVYQFMLKQQRGDGSFPLVLRKGEPPLPLLVNLCREQYLGWYDYNNYFDYLAFAGLFFYKTFETLSQKSREEKPPVPTENKRRANTPTTFLKVSKKNYDAVVVKPHGCDTNDMAFPYIVSHQRAITPCYGGESFARSLYDKNALPLPFFPRFNHTLRAKSVSWLKGSRLVMLSPLGLMVRRYRFNKKEICVQTQVVSPFRYTQQYLFYSAVKRLNAKTLTGCGYHIYASEPLIFLREAYCAMGKLNIYGVNSHRVTLTIALI